MQQHLSTNLLAINTSPYIRTCKEFSHEVFKTLLRTNLLKTPRNSKWFSHTSTPLSAEIYNKVLIQVGVDKLESFYIRPDNIDSFLNFLECINSEGLEYKPKNSLNYLPNKQTCYIAQEIEKEIKKEIKKEKGLELELEHIECNTGIEPENIECNTNYSYCFTYYGINCKCIIRSNSKSLPLSQTEFLFLLGINSGIISLDNKSEINSIIDLILNKMNLNHNLDLVMKEKDSFIFISNNPSSPSNYEINLEKLYQVLVNKGQLPDI